MTGAPQGQNGVAVAASAVEAIAAQWARLGVLFNVAPARTPDLERLLVETARVADADPRLFGMMATWMSRYAHFVAKHRLVRMIADELDAPQQALIALAVAFAQRFARRPLLPSVLRACRPLDEPRPLFAVDRSDPALATLAARHACQLSRTWGLWTDEIEPAYDALRPVEWILGRNPLFRVRARFQADLRLSVLMCLKYESVQGASEAELTRRCGVTRAAMHKALDMLWQSGEISRRRRTRGYAISSAA